MLKIEARQMFRSNGLIDDFAVYGAPEDYLRFNETIKAAVSGDKAVMLDTDTPLSIEVTLDNEAHELFTSLQNENNEYLSMEEWNERNILKVAGSEEVLIELCTFLVSLSKRGNGYSYISEYSEKHKYSQYSPEWRLHVENT